MKKILTISIYVQTKNKPYEKRTIFKFLNAHTVNTLDGVLKSRPYEIVMSTWMDWEEIGKKPYLRW